MSKDFSIGIEIVVQDPDGVDIAVVNSEVLEDDTLHMIMEDIARYIKEKEGL